jgi:L-ascorbate 6-phosphate lactonase
MANLPNEGNLLETARRARVRRGELALWNTGGAGFVLRSPEALILIDLYLGPDAPPDWTRAVPPPLGEEDLRDVDAVVVTHEHPDHADPMTLRAIGDQTAALVFGPDTGIAVARDVGVAEERCHSLAHGETAEVRDVRLTSVAMHDPNTKGANGYVFECHGLTLVHCGDSLYFPGFAELGERWSIDALCVSVGTNPPGESWYMDEADAARAARDARARAIIPMHFNLWQRMLIDPQRVATVAKWYAPSIQVIPAHYRRRITIRAERQA